MANLNQTIETPKLILKGSVEIEKEINLPYFCKYSDNHFIKVVSKYKCVVVQTYSFSFVIEVNNTPHVGIISQSVPIAEEEFNQAFEAALTKIQNQSL
jgi:hypothetical protein